MDIAIESTAFYTGHRPKDIGKCYDFNDELFQVIMRKAKKLISYVYDKAGVKTHIFGGAPGWDKIAFYAAHDLKLSQFPDMRLILAVPFADQPLSWVDDGMKEKYNQRNVDEFPGVLEFFSRQLAENKNFRGRTSIKEYLSMLVKSDEVVYVDGLPEYRVGMLPVGKYHDAKFQSRNKFMVDNGVLGISLYNGSHSGGTYNTVKYAISKGRVLINMNPLQGYEVTMSTDKTRAELDNI